MVKPGEILRLEITKPAAGGAMIARAGGQVVLVSGAIPGEEVDVRIDRIGKGVAFAHVVAVTRPSTDRRAPGLDPECGGCLYAHIDYARQTALKAEVIADAFGRIAKMPWPRSVPVAASPERGYRMRARLHLRAGQWGFFRENTHALCDARATGQLRPDTCEVLDGLAAALERRGVTDGAIELSENRDATGRAVHVEPASTSAPLEDFPATPGLSGVSASDPAQGRSRPLFGSPNVADVIVVDGVEVTLRRHVLAFFQGNRFLLADLVGHVIAAVSDATDVVDLYAGVGLFSVPLAAREAHVIAVEGDPVSAADLKENAQPFAPRLKAAYESVETFVGRPRKAPGAIVVDPPRTGMSREAIAGVVRMAAPRLVYVSCDIATLARDTRVLLDSGYRVTNVRAFDLFPNTPHIETVAVFNR